MREAHERIARYRIELVRSEDRTFLASCLEMPECRARGMTIESAIAGVRAALAARTAMGPGGAAPIPPLSESEGRLGEWAKELELVESEPAAAAAVKDEKALPSVLRAIAQWTVDRYGILLEGDGGGSFVSSSVEMPSVVGHGATPMAAIGDLRWQLNEVAFEMLNAGRALPEPQRREAGIGGGGSMALAA